MKRISLLPALLGLAFNAGAVVLYKATDSNGRVTYSDSPPPAGIAARVVPLDIDTSALPTASPRDFAQAAGARDVEELIVRRPPQPSDAGVRAAQARLDRARAALEYAQDNSTAEDWIYFGRTQRRAPRPEYEARLNSLQAEIDAAQSQLDDEERKLRLAY
jgi:hypothetical protein